MPLLVPGDPLRPRRPDEAFADEAGAARERGWDVAVVDVDRLIAGDATGAIHAAADVTGRSVYRGWMLTDEQYRLLDRALARRGIALVTSPAQYRSAHEFLGWYPRFEEFTARSAWTAGPDLAAAVLVAHSLPAGPGVIKDWVKSMKHHWDEAAFIPDVHDGEAVGRVAGRFVELRGADLVGGLVIRAFEHYVGAEHRSWWLGGRCVAVTAHPDTPDRPPPPDLDTNFLTSAIEGMEAPFMTVDLATDTEGRLRVIEVGDGQVSDRLSSLPADTLVSWLGALT